jgi:hypothetical protein
MNGHVSIPRVESTPPTDTFRFLLYPYHVWTHITYPHQFRTPATPIGRPCSKQGDQSRLYARIPHQGVGGGGWSGESRTPAQVFSFCTQPISDARHPNRTPMFQTRRPKPFICKNPTPGGGWGWAEWRERRFGWERAPLRLCALGRQFNTEPQLKCFLFAHTQS